jgi:MFS family permease
VSLPNFLLNFKPERRDLIHLLPTTPVTSGFVLGFVLGPFIWAPMSEIYGRRSLFIYTYIAFTLFNGLVCASQNLATVIVFRFLAGTFGASAMTNAGGVVADVFEAKQRGLGMAVFASAPFMGPAIGPIIGGFLGEHRGWRWVAGLLTFFSGFLTLVGFLFLPETYGPVILRQRAKRLSKITGDVYLSRGDASAPTKARQVFGKALAMPWILLFKEPIVALMALYLAVIYAILYVSTSRVILT